MNKKPPRTTSRAPSRTPTGKSGDKPFRVTRSAASAGGDRPARPGRFAGAERPARSDSDRPARPGRFAGAERPARPDGDKPARPGRFAGAERPARPDGDKPARPGRFAGAERPARPDGDRPARPARFSDRSARPDGDRPARPARFSDRPARPEGDRPARPSRFAAADRPARPERFERSDRPARPSKKPFSRRDEAPKRDYIYGIHATKLALMNPKRKLKQLFITEELLGQFEEQGVLARNVPTQVLPIEAIAKMVSPFAVHQGVVLDADPLELVHFETFLAQNTGKTEMMIILLDQVTDPHNIGAILRSAAAFKADAVIMPDRGSPQMTATMTKVASGAMEVVPLIRVSNLARAMEILKQESFWIAGLSEHGKKDIHECDLLGRIALVVGAEDSGLRRLSLESCDYVAKLPTHLPIASLNVSNATAVALYEVANQRRVAAKDSLIL